MSSKVHKNNMGYLDARELTPEEKRWWSRFNRCMNAMPETLRVVVEAYGNYWLAGDNELEQHFQVNGAPLEGNTSHLELGWSTKSISPFYPNEGGL